ncbi:Ig-like domain repeat protein [Micromonospora chersina]
MAPTPGTGLAWGRNTFGQSGSGTNIESNVPVEVDLPEGTMIIAIAGGLNHTLALTSTGTVLAWGYNIYGQLGNGTNTDSNVPVEVDLPEGQIATAIAAGGDDSFAFTSSGALLAWGENSYGQLGNGTRTSSNVPVDVDLPEGTTVTAVAAGITHSLALTSTGTVLAWGSNGFGQLGNGTNIDSNTPVQVDLPGGSTAIAIAAGGYHSLATTSIGTVLAWGYNIYGQLGNGTNTDRNTPVQVDLPQGTRITGITSGVYHNLASTSAGGLLAWGLNMFGQLGNGTNADNKAPAEVDLPAGTSITAAFAGGYHSLALTSSGTILAWGFNFYGQLGDGTNTDSNSPAQVNWPERTTVVAISAGGVHSLAIAAPVVPASSTAVQVSPSNPRPGKEIRFDATVTCNVGTPTGTVTFLDGTTTLGTATLSGSPTATAALTVPKLSLGSHDILARFAADGTCPASESNPIHIAVAPPRTKMLR